MATRMKCPNGCGGWRAQHMDDIFCRSCGAAGHTDEKMMAAQRKFDANEHRMIDKVTGQPKGRKP